MSEVHAIADVIHLSPIEADDLVADSADSDLVALSTPEFRTVATPTARKGLRLERAFWSALGVISARLGVKRSKLIANLMQDAADQDLNATSAIRSFAVNALASELERTRQLYDRDNFISLLLRAPLPSFAVGADKRLLKVNGEFNHFVRILFAEVGPVTTKRPALHINLETPVSQIFADLAVTKGSLECIMNVTHGTRVRRVRTRIVAVPPHAPSALVGHVIP